MNAAAPEASEHLLRPAHTVMAWTRLALAVNTLVVNLMRVDSVAHPDIMLAASVLLLGWSVLLAVLRRWPDDGRWALLIADIVVAVVFTVASSWVLGPQTGVDASIALPVYWQAAAPITAAIWWGPSIGLGVGLLVTLASLPQTQFTAPHVWSTNFTICLVAWGAGVLANQLRRAARERDRNLAINVALAERERLGRLVHDGTLQVLSLVEREGRQLGPRGQSIAQMARVQEIALRTMLQDRTVNTVVTDAVGRVTEVDVAARLNAMSSERVTVSLMAGAVMMPQDRATEVLAAVAQIVRNAEAHAGPDAHVWMLLEEEDDALVISVRDNGVGMTQDVVREAFASGRLGIRQSIIGRVRDLGGTAEVQSSPGRGVEWELRVPLVQAGARDPGTHVHSDGSLDRGGVGRAD